MSEGAGYSSSTAKPDKRCRRCYPPACDYSKILPKGWTRERWEWAHQAADPERWADAPTLLAYPSGQFDPNAEDIIIDGIAYTLATDGRTLLRDGKPEIIELRGDEAPPLGLTEAEMLDKTKFEEKQHDNINDDTDAASQKTEPPKQPKAVPALALQLAVKLWGEPIAGKHNCQFGADDSTRKVLDLVKGTWFDFEYSIGGNVRDLMRMVQDQARANNSHIIGEPLALKSHGDAAPAPQPWLIRNRLPETGKGLLVGQWGMYKTFAALDLSAHVMLGWDWTGEPIYRQCGVLCIAKEGSSSIPMRLAAIVENIINPRLQNEPQHRIKDTRRLPFTWSSECPALLGVAKDDPLPILNATAKLAHKQFMEQCGLPLGLIWIDTMSSAGGFADENDNAEAAKLMGVLGNLSVATGAVVIGVDHLGKNIEAGTRGGSAKEANSDFVLALLGNKDLAGNVSDSRMSLRKVREGPTGREFPFAPKVVNMGNDQHGNSISSVVLDWNVERAAPKSARTKTVQLLDKALANALQFHGKTVKPVNEAEVKAVARTDLADNFKAIYDPRETRTDNAKRVAFQRALADAADHIRDGVIDGVSHVWPVGPVPF